MVKSGAGEERKLRSDKKVDVKPTLSLDFKKQLYKFAELSNEPVKDIAERMCLKGLTFYPVVEILCKWLRRNYIYNQSIAIGRLERPKLKINTKGDTGKVTIRLMQDDYDQLKKLAFALDITPTSTAAVLIRVVTKNQGFMYEFVEDLENADEEQKEVLKRFVSTYWIF